MRIMEGDLPITNLTQVWWNEEKSDLLAWNGFYECGSDYDLLQKLITCVRRDPTCVTANQIRGEWQALFGAELSFDAASCGELWRYAAQSLFQAPLTKKQIREACQKAVPIKREGDFSVVDNRLPASTVSIHALTFPQKSWKEWSACALEWLRARVEDGAVPSLKLPVDFCPIKPNLYRVERILSGQESNRDLWLSQLAFFLFSFCEKKQIRPVLLLECEWQSGLSLLKDLSALTRFPNLLIESNGLPNRHTWNEICRTVLKNRGESKEGEPPVFCAVDLKKKEWVPQNLLFYNCIKNEKRG